MTDKLKALGLSFGELVKTALLIGAIVGQGYVLAYKIDQHVSNSAIHLTIADVKFIEALSTKLENYEKFDEAHTREVVRQVIRELKADGVIH